MITIQEIFDNVLPYTSFDAVFYRDAVSDVSSLNPPSALISTKQLLVFYMEGCLL
jgi:hypothetical protein